MAAELILILPDFFPTRDDGAVAAAAPRLPALETLLATSRRRPLLRSWRAELAARVNDALPPGASAASVVASVVASGMSATPVPPLRGCWLATPVYYFAGLDSVHLHPAGLLELSCAAQTALAGDFDRVFADSAWRLRPCGGRELLLIGPPLAASGVDPAICLGRKLERERIQGSDAATLRRLLVEIEMWLHEHPLNQQRQAEGALPVSGLWPWGSEPLAAAREVAVPAHRLPREATLYGRDSVAEALWRLRAGSPVLALPERFAATVAGRTGTQVVIYPTAGRPEGAGVLEALERDWLAPALESLRAGAIAAIELMAGELDFRLRRLNLLRFWRARAPWQEALA